MDLPEGHIGQPCVKAFLTYQINLAWSVLAWCPQKRGSSYQTRKSR